MAVATDTYAEMTGLVERLRSSTEDALRYELPYDEPESEDLVQVVDYVDVATVPRAEELRPLLEELATLRGDRREAALELERIQDVVGPSVPVVGCYTYGEQAPLGTRYAYGRASVQTGACLIVALGS